MPEDLKYSIAEYFTIKDIEILESYPEFSTTLDKNYIWKFLWDTYVGGTTADILLNPPNHRKAIGDFISIIEGSISPYDELLCCTTGGHDIYLKYLMKDTKITTDVIYQLYLTAHDTKIEQILIEYVGGIDILNAHISSIAALPPAHIASIRRIPRPGKPGRPGRIGKPGKSGIKLKKF
jgi:hypothetical protein